MATERRQLLLEGTPEAVALPAPVRTRTPRVSDPNPCVAVYGPGPAGATCATCARLIHNDNPRRGYLKCTLRGVNRSERTDHRAGWPACGRYGRKEASPDDND